MIKIIRKNALYFILTIFYCHAAENFLPGPDISRMTGDFASVTRMPSVSGNISMSESLYALDRVGTDRSPSPLKEYIDRGSDGDSDDDYEQRMEATMSAIKAEKQKERKYGEESLVSFLMLKQGVRQEDLNSLSLTVVQHLDTIEAIITVLLEKLEGDLINALKEKGVTSYTNLSEIKELTARHKSEINTINKTFTNVGDELIPLIFSYYSKNMSNLLNRYCKPDKADAQEQWQRKMTILTMNIYCHLDQFAELFMSNSRTISVAKATTKAVQPALVSFYLETCEYFTHWYSHNRSSITQGLSWLGARESNTRKLFISFDSEYQVKFSFLFKDVLVGKDLKEKNSAVLAHFDRTDRGFSEGVSALSNLLSWNSTKPAIAEPSLAPSSSNPKSGKGTWSSWW